MSYEVYRYIFLIAAILCGVMLLVSVLLFIFLRIPKVISDLTGATARKAIKNIREQNERSGEKLHKVSAFNRDRGMLTDKISASGNLQRQPNNNLHVGIQTSKIGTQNLVPDQVASETTLLQSETTLLQSETTLLQPQMIGETAPLGAEHTLGLNVDYSGETSVLSQKPAQVTVFEILYDITYIHTNERII